MDGLSFVSHQASGAAQTNPFVGAKTSSLRAGCSLDYALHGTPLRICTSKLIRKYTHNVRPAISIIEVMVFIVVMAIAVIGSSGYRYFSTMDVRKSDSELTAGRIAWQLCESWKGMGGGDSSYNPVTDSHIGLDINSAPSSLAPHEPLNFTLLKDGGYYQVKVSDNDIVRTYYVTMSYYTINSINGNLETLNVIINWPASETLPKNGVATQRSFRLSELLITH
jgi:hypothetical protein